MSAPAPSPYPAGGPQGMPGGSADTSTPTGRTPGAGLRKWGKILLILGVVLLALSVVLGVILAIVGFSKVADSTSDSTVFVGEATVSLEGGTSQQLYSHADAGENSCTVTGADGSTPGDGSNQQSTFTSDGATWESFDSFTPATTQEYTITCTMPREVMVAPALSAGGIVGGVVGILVAALGGSLFFFVAIIGLVLLLVGRSQAKKATGTV
jgi:hypothetical protein